MRGVVWDGDRLHVTDELEVRPPHAGEVTVRLLRSGICHSDLNMMESGLGGTPVVLGHEAAGEVMALGDGVNGFRIGDQVMVGTQTPCGTCRECRRGTSANCDVTWGYVPSQPFRWRGQPTYNFANVSSWAGEIVVKAAQLYRTDGLPPEQAALIGCAVSTGYCAARSLGKVGQGDRVAVFGVGGIGVNAIQAARLAGAEVVAVDINADKEAAARSFGAEDFLTAQRGEDGMALAARLAKAFAPIDVAIECSGAPSAVEAAIHGVKRGGRAVLIGIAAPGAKCSVSLDTMIGGREIISEMNGGARPEIDYPALIVMAREREIDVAAQVSRVWPLAEIEDAIAALRRGEVTRAVLDHSI